MTDLSSIINSVYSDSSKAGVASKTLSADMDTFLKCMEQREQEAQFFTDSSTSVSFDAEADPDGTEEMEVLEAISKYEARDDFLEIDNFGANNISILDSTENDFDGEQLVVTVQNLDTVMKMLAKGFKFNFFTNVAEQQ